MELLICSNTTQLTLCFDWLVLISEPYGVTLITAAFYVWGRGDPEKSHWFPQSSTMRIGEVRLWILLAWLWCLTINCYCLMPHCSSALALPNGKLKHTIECYQELRFLIMLFSLFLCMAEKSWFLPLLLCTFIFLVYILSCFVISCFRIFWVSICYKWLLTLFFSLH